MPSPVAIPRIRFNDAAGAPLALGWLDTYAAGGTTPLATYSESTGTTPNANPIQLDANGEAVIWLGDSGAYDFRLRNSALVVQPVPGLAVQSMARVASAAGTTTLASLASTATAAVGAALVGWLDTLAYAANTVGWALRSLAGGNSILRYIPIAEWPAIAAGTTTTDLTSYIASALTAKNDIYVPSGTFIGEWDLSGKRGKTIRCAGRDVTILKNVDATPVFTLNNTASDCKSHHFEGFKVQNRDEATYPTCDAFLISGNATNENDFHTFKEVDVVDMRYGWNISSRMIWSSWEDCHAMSCVDGFHCDTTQNVSVLSLRQCRFGANTGYGMYLNKASGDPFFGWTLDNVTNEKNALNGLRVSGAASGIAGFTIIGGHYEENTTTVAAGATAPRKANIFIDAAQCIGLNIIGVPLLGTPLATALDWGVYISSTTCSGYIGPCRPGTFTLGFVSNTSGVVVVAPQEGGTTTLSGAGAYTLGRESFTSFTGTLTGCTTSPTGTIQYVAQLHQVTLDIPIIEATSNTTAATITGMPAAIRPTATKTLQCLVKDNGTVVHGLAQIDSTGTITLQNGIGGGAFTGSGTKGVRAQQITYVLD
jgi:hypothetical protein